MPERVWVRAEDGKQSRQSGGWCPRWQINAAQMPTTSAVPRWPRYAMRSGSVPRPGLP